jgi:hypothetical protein
MLEWFQSGGVGMFTILAVGAGSLGFGARALGRPTPERLAILCGLPGLIAVLSLFTFGTNMWAVNRFLSRATTMPPAEAATLGIVGLTESAQALTLGGLMAMVVIVVRILAEAKKARTDAA